MEPAIQSVFVSSTWFDLQPERLAVEEALIRMREFKFIGMEYFSSRDETTRQASLDEIDQAQIYIGIIGGRYGSGITEDEYLRARERGLSCFIYFKDETEVTPEQRDAEPEKIARLNALKSELSARHIITRFSAPYELVVKIQADLHRWSFDHHQSRRISGDAIRSIAVSSEGENQYWLDTGSQHGGIARRQQMPRPRPRSTPLVPTVRPMRGMLDRATEIDSARSSLESSIPVEFYGQPGLGKTSLLRHLAYQFQYDRFPDGAVFLDRIGRKPATDVLQFIFDSFFECDAPYKPRDVELRQLMQDKRALILMDDVEFSREEIEHVMDAAPDCVFTISSSERHLFGKAYAMRLHGLPADEALELLSRELAREMTAYEQQFARNLCAALEGHPLRILQAAAMARENQLTLADVAAKLQTEQPGEALTVQTISSLSESEKKVLAALGATGGAAIDTESLSELTGIPDVKAVLIPLLQLRLIEPHSSGYCLSGDLNDFLPQVWDLTEWRKSLLGYFTIWAEKHQREPKLIQQESEAILAILGWANDVGHSQGVIRLGRAIDHALALSGWWETWDQVLQKVLQSSRAIKDRVNEAWALHQMGTRALCLGKYDAARRLLAEALEKRISIGDNWAASVTRHNLDWLFPPTPLPSLPKQPTSTRSGRGRLLKFGMGALGLLIVGLGLRAMSGYLWPDADPARAPTLKTTPTPVSTSTAGITPTSTIGLAPTLTKTPAPSPLGKPELPPPRITFFNARPAAIKRGDKTELCYGVENANRVSIAPRIKELAPSRNLCFKTKSIKQSMSFTLEARNTQGQVVRRSITVNVSKSR